MVTQGKELLEKRIICQRVQAFSCKMNNSLRLYTEHGKYS
jgi:hypothetical protein